MATYILLTMFISIAQPLTDTGGQWSRPNSVWLASACWVSHQTIASKTAVVGSGPKAFLSNPDPTISRIPETSTDHIYCIKWKKNSNLNLFCTQCAQLHIREQIPSQTYKCNEEGRWSRFHSHCMWTSWHHLIHSLNCMSMKPPIRHRELNLWSPILRTVFCHWLDWRAEGSSPLAK